MTDMQYLSEHDVMIGNYVMDNYSGSVVHVTHADYSLMKMRPFSTSPIQLTKKWLTDLGFNRIQAGLYRRKSVDIYWKPGTGFYYETKRVYRKIKYVHQLQILYLGLEGAQIFKFESHQMTGDAVKLTGVSGFITSKKAKAVRKLYNEISIKISEMSGNMNYFELQPDFTYRFKRITYK